MRNGRRRSADLAHKPPLADTFFILKCMQDAPSPDPELIMKPFLSKLFVCFVLMATGAAVLAQGVYVTPGASGPVFSDKPRAGSKEVTLKPLNVIPPVETAPAVKVAPEAKGARAGQELPAPVYRSLAIVSPENNGSVAGDSSVLEVRLAADPPLLLGDGHVFVVRVNGRFVERRFTSAEFIIPPEFWVDGYIPANQSMQIDASIVDGAGQVMMRAAPIVFYTRQLSVRPGFYPQLPGYLPPPVRQPRPPRPPHKSKMPEQAVEVPSAAIKK